MPTTGPEAELPAVLTCERIKLRPVAEADIPAIVELAGDPDVALMTANVPHPYKREHAEEWLRVIAERPHSEHATFALERTEDGVFLGVMGAIFDEAGTEAEIAYWLGKPYWSHGYMSEAVQNLVQAIFALPAVQTVWARVLPENLRSINVLKRAGLVHSGGETRNAPARLQDRALDVFRLSRKDWADARRGA